MNTGYKSKERIEPLPKRHKEADLQSLLKKICFDSESADLN
jgi:hypothetical protein